MLVRRDVEKRCMYASIRTDITQVKGRYTSSIIIAVALAIVLGMRSGRK